MRNHDNIKHAVTTNSPRSSANNGGVDCRSRALAHGEVGYKNAQEIVRFIDTKTTFLTTASTLTIGFVLEAIKQYVQLPNNFRASFEDHPYFLLGLRALVIFSLFAGALCLWCCIMSLVGRPPKRDMNFRHTVLFPFYSGNQDECRCCARIVEGMSEQDIAEEYKTQVWNLGLIVKKKVVRHRWAAWMLLAQLALLVIGGIIVVFCSC